MELLDDIICMKSVRRGSRNIELNPFETPH